MKRKNGFSLVELLIVLAVMAALIATITPVALNAIKKAKATQVAQNIKTMASALENAAYVNGVDATAGTINTVTDITDLGRDIDTAKYGAVYSVTNGTVDATIMSIAEGDINTIQTIIKDAEQETCAATLTAGSNSLSSMTLVNGTTLVTYYTIQFEVY